MAVPGFSVNDLIDAAVNVKLIYDSFFHKHTNAAAQLKVLIDEIDRFADNLEENRELFREAGLKYGNFGAINDTLKRCDDFLDDYKAVLSDKKTPESILKTGKFPYQKKYIQELKDDLRAHTAELNHLLLVDLAKRTSPKIGPEPHPRDVQATIKRRTTINGTLYTPSPTPDGVLIYDRPAPDGSINGDEYSEATTPASPSIRGVKEPGSYPDGQTLFPPRPVSRGMTPHSSPEMPASVSVRSISPGTSPVLTPYSRQFGVASPPPPCPELILPQPALDYTVAQLWFGTKKIELKRKLAGRPSTSPNSPGREIVIINEKGDERLKHRIKLGSALRCYPYTWNSGKHSPLEVTFNPGSSHSMYVNGKQIELGSAIPRYVFASIVDFTNFQSAVRNKKFLGAFSTNRITSETSGRYGDATDQHLKIWRDKETGQCSLSFYGSSLRKARDLDFPFKYIKKEPESTRRSEELILRFDLSSWSQLRPTAPSITRKRPSTPSESEYTTSRSRNNTFSTVNTVSTDRTASTGVFSRHSTTGSIATTATSVATITPGSRAPSFGSQNSDSGHSAVVERPMVTVEELAKKMKYLKIAFRDETEANRFRLAYKAAIVDTPSLPIDFHHIDWRGNPIPHPHAQHHQPSQTTSQSAPPSLRPGYAEMEGQGRHLPAELGGGGGYAVEMPGKERYPASVAEMEGGSSVFAVEMPGREGYPVGAVELGGGGAGNGIANGYAYAAEMVGSNSFPAGAGAFEMDAGAG
ncbi:hypothetical protein V494_00469, partial [Pseudogymnoascus sp. VKM F-4513 (FW-928)]